ncbi:hypothetical protein [Neobacillus sp. 19]|uniref:hypothetical protein n=1 Tax=Neobacillus sp. 19 TaxID=3394458 RepID=UPI003BF73A20
MKCSVMYSKKDDVYAVKIDDPFADPVYVDASKFSEFLRKHGHGVDGSIPLSGMIHVYKDELACVLE